MYWLITNEACAFMATCLTDKHTLKDLHVKRTGWFKILLLQCVKQDSVSNVVVCYVTLPQHKIKNNKTDWFVCDSRPRALFRPVTCGKTGRRCVGGFSFLRVNFKTNTVQLEDARGRFSRLISLPGVSIHHMFRVLSVRIRCMCIITYSCTLEEIVVNIKQIVCLTRKILPFIWIPVTFWGPNHLLIILFWNLF